MKVKQKYKSTTKQSSTEPPKTKHFKSFETFLSCRNRRISNSERRWSSPSRPENSPEKSYNPYSLKIGFKAQEDTCFSKGTSAGRFLYTGFNCKREALAQLTLPSNSFHLEMEYSGATSTGKESGRSRKVFTTVCRSFCNNALFSASDSPAQRSQRGTVTAIPFSRRTDLVMLYEADTSFVPDADFSNPIFRSRAVEEIGLQRAAGEAPGVEEKLPSE